MRKNIMKNYLDERKLQKLEERGKLTVKKIEKLCDKQIKLAEKVCKKTIKLLEKITDDEIRKLTTLQVEAQFLKDYLTMCIEIDKTKEELSNEEDEDLLKVYNLAIHHMMRQAGLMKYVLDKCGEIMEKEPEYVVYI